MKLLFKLNFTLIISVILFTHGVYAKDIKFIQVTDSHFSITNGDYSQSEVENSNGVLEKTIDDINSIPEIDFVVFTGDNIDKANPVDLKKFLAIANKLKFSYYIVIGNHEVFKSQNLDKKEYMKIVSRYSKNCHFKSANYMFKKQDIIFLVVDGAKEIIPGPAGYYKIDTLKWLDKQLTKYKDDNVIILQHFPIVEPYYNRTHTTYNVKDYESILKRHSNVIAIFSGHYHANAETQKDGIYHVSTPSLLEAPHDYKIVEISVKNKKDCQIYTRLRHAE